MSRNATLPARPLSTWTPEETMLHACATEQQEIARLATSASLRKMAREEAGRALAALNESLAARGARCGYRLG